MVIETALAMLGYLSARSDDDWVDRMHYFYTSNMVIAMAILVSFKQFGGKPVECMFPNKFPSSWEQYAENYCWSQDTYFLAPDVHVEQIKAEERYEPERKLSYYQWVPFFLLLEAACFRMPSLLWKYLAGHSGIRIHEIVNMAVDPQNINPDTKKLNVNCLTIHLQNALRFQRRIQRKKVNPHKVLKFLNLPYSAYYVTAMYLFTKVLYLVNVIVQLWAMNHFLETNKYGWYGFGVVKDILTGTPWETSGVFPRVSLCDFEVRQVANIQRYSVQCVLVINIFNEKIFIFLWFWYMSLVVATLVSFFYWFIVMVMPWFGRWFVSRNLELSEMPFDPEGSRKDVDRFVNSYLHSDGIFVLRMVTMHSGIIFGTDLVLALWRQFYGIEEQRRKETVCQIENDKKNNESNLLRQRKSAKDKKKKKKDKLSDDDSDCLIAGLIGHTAKDDGSSSSSSDEEEDQKKRFADQQTYQAAVNSPTSNTSTLAVTDALVAGAALIGSDGGSTNMPSAPSAPGEDQMNPESGNGDGTNFGGENSV